GPTTSRSSIATSAASIVLTVEPMRRRAKSGGVCEQGPQVVRRATLGRGLQRPATGQHHGDQRTGEVLADQQRADQPTTPR
ncbi:hypothetical protein H7H80_03170, partial [Mycobacterium interjectum]|nr:hypothetical protein [Mycobacterium interjectum]